jgi:hypothetical protein
MEIWPIPSGLFGSACPTNGRFASLSIVLVLVPERHSYACTSRAPVIGKDQSAERQRCSEPEFSHQSEHEDDIRLRTSA